MTTRRPDGCPTCSGTLVHRLASRTSGSYLRCLECDRWWEVRTDGPGFDRPACIIGSWLPWVRSAKLPTLSEQEDRMAVDWRRGYDNRHTRGER